MTETLVTGLRLVRRARAYDKAMALRGKVLWSSTWITRVSGIVVDTSVWIAFFAGRHWVRVGEHVFTRIAKETSLRVAPG